MSTVTYKQLKDDLRAKLWPDGEPSSLRLSHDASFRDAMIEFGKWVPCVRQNNVSVHKACSTYVECAQTVLGAPSGLIRVVYTIANDDWCDRVYYDRVEFRDLRAMAFNAILGWTAPENKSLPALQQGIKFAESSTDSKCGRARFGVWAWHNHRLYLFPWIQSNESVVVEWDGWKQEWSDEDVLDRDIWTLDFDDVILNYVAWKHEHFFGCKTRDAVLQFKSAYDAGLADKMYWCKQKQDQAEAERGVSEELRGPTSAEVDDDVPVEAPTETVWAQIADYGVDTSDSAAVAALVKSWSPQFVMAAGDCDYIGDYDLSTGKIYADFIHPYSGAFASAATENKFWPIPGNHDWDNANLAEYLEFFTLPPNERYYDIVAGGIHFFLVSSDVREPDGRTVTSKQAEWVKAKALLSPARWKIVIIHDPPYTSGVTYTPGIADVRWPYLDWGIDIVIAGSSHSYERLEVGGLPYIVNGCGGRDTNRTFNVPIAGSLVRHAEVYGALKCTATCAKLKFEFYNVAGAILDTLELVKA